MPGKLFRRVSGEGEERRGSRAGLDHSNTKREREGRQEEVVKETGQSAWWGGRETRSQISQQANHKELQGGGAELCQTPQPENRGFSGCLPYSPFYRRHRVLTPSPPGNSRVPITVLILLTKGEVRQGGSRGHVTCAWPWIRTRAPPNAMYYAMVCMSSYHYPSPNFWGGWEVRERELEGFSYSFYVIFRKLIQWKKWDELDTILCLNYWQPFLF